MNDTSEQNTPNPTLLVPVLVAHSPWSGGEAQTRNHRKEICRHTRISFLIRHFKEGLSQIGHWLVLKDGQIGVLKLTWFSTISHRPGNAVTTERKSLSEGLAGIYKDFSTAQYI